MFTEARCRRYISSVPGCFPLYNRLRVCLSVVRSVFLRIFGPVGWSQLPLWLLMNCSCRFVHISSPVAFSARFRRLVLRAEMLGSGLDIRAWSPLLLGLASLVAVSIATVQVPTLSFGFPLLLRLISLVAVSIATVQVPTPPLWSPTFYGDQTLVPRPFASPYHSSPAVA